MGKKTAGRCSASFQSLRSQAVAKGQLFTDPSFPADDSSLFLDPPAEASGVVWKRPGEITSDPRLFVEGALGSDVSHDKPTNAWFVTACTALASERSLWAKVVPDHKEQEWSQKRPYVGIFRFCFWAFGHWTDVVVDDRLPTRDGRLLGCRSRAKGEFWGPLLEKAYAKYLGCYEQLEACSLSDALVDLTGGAAEILELSSYARDPMLRDALFAKMVAAGEAHSLLCCAISVDRLEEMGERTERGLLKGHAYAVTGARSVELGRGGLATLLGGSGQRLSMVRLRSPWLSGTWTGPFGQGHGQWCYGESQLTQMFSSSAEWSRTSSADRDKLGLVLKEDGDFWMTLEDFVGSFTDMSICHLVRSGWFQLGRTLVEQSFFGEWTVGERGTPLDRAGGCINHRDSFLRNPQYRLDVTGDEGMLLVYLLQSNLTEQEGLGENMVIGFHIMQVEVNRLFRVHVLKPKACSSEYVRSRGVFLECSLKRGRYVLLPTTFEPGLPGRFLLRLFSERSLDAKELLKDVPSAKLLPCQSTPCLATIVHIIGAKNLEKQDLFGTADPYCVVMCEGQSVRSGICHETLDPVWNLSAIFYRKDSSSTIKIQVWSSNVMMDTYMAKAYVEAPPHTDHVLREVPLVGHKKRPDDGARLGTLTLELTTTDDLLAV
ncbi:unnamed protein product [Ixodes persulcatus]